MAKFLIVSGEDYSAMDFNKEWGSPQEACDAMEQGEDINTDYYECRVVELNGVITENIFDFIKNELCDYDALKGHDMFIVK